MSKLRGTNLTAWAEIEGKKVSVSQFRVTTNGKISPDTFPTVSISLVVGRTFLSGEQKLQVTNEMLEKLYEYPIVSLYVKVEDISSVESNPGLSPGTYKIFEGDIGYVGAQKQVTWGQQNSIEIEITATHVLARLTLGDVSSFPFYGMSFIAPLATSAKTENQSYDFSNEISIAEENFLDKVIRAIIAKRMDTDPDQFGTIQSRGILSARKALRGSSQDAVNYVKEAFERINLTEFPIDNMSGPIRNRAYRNFATQPQKIASPTLSALEIIWSSILGLKGWILPNATGATIRKQPGPASNKLKISLADYNAISLIKKRENLIDKFIGGGFLYFAPVFSTYTGTAPTIATSYLLPEGTYRGGVLTHIQAPSWLTVVDVSPDSNSKPADITDEEEGKIEDTLGDRPVNDTSVQFLKHEIVRQRLISDDIQVTLPMRFDIAPGTQVEIEMPSEITTSDGHIMCGLVTGLDITMDSGTDQANLILTISQVETKKIYDILSEDGKHPFSNGPDDPIPWAEPI